MSAATPPVRISIDNRTRFPLLKITGLDFAICWLPITRVQLELFLSDVYDARYDANWYINQVLKDNPRVSPNNVTPKNVNGILATNILLTEARRIADWFSEKGQLYDLPTAQQWTEIYNVCNKVEIQTQLPEKIDHRAYVMITRLQKLSDAQTLADQMLINSNISEYVYSDEARQTCQITDGRRQGNITALTKSFQQEGSRRTNLTFRLIRRMVKGGNDVED